MKRLTFLLAFIAFFAVTPGFAQDKKMASPPAKAEGTIGNVKVTINYHQPSARGRKIMGELVPYGEVWRTGANNSTSIEFSGPVKIEGKDVPKGKYALFTIPGENEWVIILNKGIDWGAYKYKQEDDVLRVNVKPAKTDSFVETFKIDVAKDEVQLKWENTVAAFKVKG
ncbi:MAG TPA: DUF2911 domain-containing protein [Ohtaekwangia sp.]|nr:DUF2911 domain-containing protein [Ohtaekwangia sp.]